MFQTVTTQAQVEALLGQEQPLWLLKHSTACSISHAALEQFSTYLAANAQASAAVVIIQEQRPLSTWIAERLKRAHQSPQLFLIQGGTVRWTASHWSITAQAMGKALQESLPPAA
jgi:bacillithiol system protein YtxJ